VYENMMKSFVGCFWPQHISKYGTLLLRAA